MFNLYGNTLFRACFKAFLTCKKGLSYYQDKPLKHNILWHNQIKPLYIYLGRLIFACASSGQDAVRRCLHIGAGILLPRLPLLFASRKCKALPLLLVSPLCSETIAVSLIFARRFLFAAATSNRMIPMPDMGDAEAVRKAALLRTSEQKIFR